MSYHVAEYFFGWAFLVTYETLEKWPIYLNYFRVVHQEARTHIHTHTHTHKYRYTYTHAQTLSHVL